MIQRANIMKPQYAILLISSLFVSLPTYGKAETPSVLIQRYMIDNMDIEKKSIKCKTLEEKKESYTHQCKVTTKTQKKILFFVDLEKQKVFLSKGK